MFSGKRKYHLSRYYKKDHFQGRIFWKDHLFRIFEENIIFPGIFWEISSFLLCLKNKIYFREKEISSLLIIQERSYSSAMFLKRPFFQNIWKRKIWFFVQLMMESYFYNIPKSIKGVNSICSPGCDSCVLCILS